MQIYQFSCVCKQRLPTESLWGSIVHKSDCIRGLVCDLLLNNDEGSGVRDIAIYVFMFFFTETLWQVQVYIYT